MTWSLRQCKLILLTVMKVRSQKCVSPHKTSGVERAMLLLPINRMDLFSCLVEAPVATCILWLLTSSSIPAYARHLKLFPIVCFWCSLSSAHSHITLGQCTISETLPMLTSPDEITSFCLQPHFLCHATRSRHEFWELGFIRHPGVGNYFAHYNLGNPTHFLS